MPTAASTLECALIHTPPLLEIERVRRISRHPTELSFRKDLHPTKRAITILEQWHDADDRLNMDFQVTKQYSLSHIRSLWDFLHT